MLIVDFKTNYTSTTFFIKGYIYLKWLAAYYFDFKINLISSKEQIIYLSSYANLSYLKLLKIANIFKENSCTIY